MSTPGKGTAAETRQAWIEHRRILTDELVQHSDVWVYIAEMALQVASEFPVGSKGRAVMARLSVAATDTAGLLVEAADAEHRAAS